MSFNSDPTGMVAASRQGMALGAGFGAVHNTGGEQLTEIAFADPGRASSSGSPQSQTLAQLEAMLRERQSVRSQAMTQESQANTRASQAGARVEDAIDKSLELEAQINTQLTARDQAKSKQTQGQSIKTAGETKKTSGEQTLAQGEQTVASGGQKVNTGNQNLIAANNHLQKANTQMATAQAMPDPIVVGQGENPDGSVFDIWGPNPAKPPAITAASAEQASANQEIGKANEEIAEGEREKAEGERLKIEGEQEKAEGEEQITESAAQIEEGQREEEEADAKISEAEEQKFQVDEEKFSADKEYDAAKYEAVEAGRIKNESDQVIGELQAAIDMARAEEARQKSQGGASNTGNGGGGNNGGMGGGGSGSGAGGSADPGTGGGIGNGGSFVAAARGILISVGRISASMSLNANPIVQIAKNLTNKGLTEQAIAYLEAALVDSTLQGTPTNQAIILLKAMASTIHGEAETNISFWKEVINENKQLGKQTHDLAKMA